MPNHFYSELNKRGFVCRSASNPLTQKTICVSIKPEIKRYYPLSPDYGEAIIQTLDELDILIMLKSTGNDKLLREYIKATHKVYGMITPFKELNQGQ